MNKQAQKPAFIYIYSTYISAYVYYMILKEFFKNSWVSSNDNLKSQADIDL